MTTTLRVEPNPSRQLLGLLVFAHVGGLACLLPLSLPVAAKILLGALVVASFIHQGGLHAWRRSERTIVRLELEARGGASVITRAGRVYRRVEMRDVFVHPSLIVIRFEKPDASLVLLGDMLDPEQHRRLRVWLRSSFDASTH